MIPEKCSPKETENPLNPWCGCGQKIGKPTVSKCLSCGNHATAYTVKSDDTPARIYLVRECFACSKTPGQPLITSARISKDSDFFWTKEEGSECCTNGQCSSSMGTNAVNAQQLHTCTMLVELVEGCNMSCPTCYADSPQTTVEHSKPLDFELFKKNVLKRLDEQGRIDIIQLSGGEPTLHPQFFEIVDWCAKEERIADVLLNTNGIKINDSEFLKQLVAVAPIGRFSVYLQFDGMDEDGQIELRAGDFRKVRERAIEALTTNNIPVCLTMVVTQKNLKSVWKTVARSIENPLIKWVTFQPEFITGRNDLHKLIEDPISVADIIHSLADPSGGVMTLKSFMPLPCSHPNCGTIGFLVKVNNEWHSVSEIVDLNQYTDFIKDKMNIDIDQIVPGSCGCDDFPLDELLKQFGINKEDVKMIFIKPFMDNRSWDEDRIKSCCTHVLLPDGTLDSFCRHYANKK